MANPVCTASKLVTLEFDYIGPIVMSLAAVSLIPPLYIYITSYIKGDLKTSKLLFYFGTAFFIFVILYYINSIITLRFVCHNEKIEIPLPYSYVPIRLTLLLILFMRLIRIFKGTVYNVSLCTIRLYIGGILFVLSTGLTGFSLFSYSSKYDGIGFAIWILGAVVHVVLTISLNVLFINKLFKVHMMAKDNVDDDNRLLNSITKTTVLCITSTLILVLNHAINFARLHGSTSLHFQFITTLIHIPDIHINFLAILLSFTYFNDWYNKIYGACHSRCINTILRVVYGCNKRNLDGTSSKVEEVSTTTQQTEMKV